MGRLTDAIKHLLIINILFFVATNLYGDYMYQWFSLWFPESNNFGLWQILSHMFMHGGFMHILFNMYALWAFGSPLERMWGRNKFLFFYFSAGLGAALIHTGVNYYTILQAYETVSAWLPKEVFYEILNVDSARGNQMLGELFYNNAVEILNNKGIVTQIDDSNFGALFDAHALLKTPAVGASGAIYGILVAFGMSFPNSELFLIFLPVPIKAKYFIPVLVGLDLFSGVTGTPIFGSGIAHWAHVGGALFGFIMMWYWKKNQFNKNRWDR